MTVERIPHTLRVPRARFPCLATRRIVAGMSTEPLPSLAELLAEADRVEGDALALSLSFPRAVGRTLRLAARAGTVNRHAASLNTELARAGVARRVAPVASAVPIGVVDPMWFALLAAEPVEAGDGGGRCDGAETLKAARGAPQREHEAVGIAGEQAGGARVLPEGVGSVRE